MTEEQPWDKLGVHDELERARVAFHGLIGSASEADWARPTRGTRWSNEQLLFHMLFGYMIVQALLKLVRLFGRLPRGLSRAYARLLDAAVKPFDEINYVGSWTAAKVFNRRRMGVKFDRVVAALHRRLDAESEADLMRDALYGPLGSLLQGLHDARGHLPLSDSAL
ncbi:DinB family protein [Streptomyces sioyaensis]|uniref:DinB family protein n=1 Tax=Streptomyces sioyaensis TaxID=67364 RepID=UPI00378E8687